MTQTEAINRLEEILGHELYSFSTCTGSIDDCPIDECMLCSVRDCPGDEPLHYHHDGCPYCVQATKIVDPIIQAFETIAKATVESDRTIVELVKGLSNHVNKTEGILIETLKVLTQHVRTLEDKVDMLMELHRLGDDESGH